MGRRVFRRRTGSDPLSGLCDEVSEVLNRVRQAFGHLPMKPVADAPEVRAAEAAVDLAARQVRKGEAGPADWQRALADYEAAWMAALRALQRDLSAAPAAPAAQTGQHRQAQAGRKQAA